MGMADRKMPLKKHEDHVMENAGVSFWDVLYIYIIICINIIDYITITDMVSSRL